MMWSTILPSSLNMVAFTPAVHVTLIVMLYLAQTPVSRRWVNDNIPQKMLRMNYWHNMADWFPNIQAAAPDKGGVGFTNNAGNAILDYMTYLALRLSWQLFRNKIDAYLVWMGGRPPCSYVTYSRLSDASLSHIKFMMSQEDNAQESTALRQKLLLAEARKELEGTGLVSQEVSYGTLDSGSNVLGTDVVLDEDMGITSMKNIKVMGASRIALQLMENNEFQRKLVFI